ncbi:MAG: hypothetical protein ABL999_00330 [Pyrinomonadaceae bacterium]
MSVAGNPQSNLAVVPLGAGDLIDRAVRFYRKYFWTFILIAAPPVIVGTIVSVGWTFMGRQIFAIGVSRDPAETTFYYIFLWFGSIVIWLTETIATLVVMGGASRNFVRHLLFGEAITFRETYRNAAKRLGGLIFASSLISVLLGSVGLAVFYFAAVVLLILIGIIFWAVGAIIPVVGFILSVIVGIVVAGAAIWLFFLAASRLAYVPQVMLVEGQGVFSAIGRSASLASGSVKRLAALFVFSTVAAYSALAILYLPLAWYASANGVNLMGFDRDIIPAWYEVASNLIWQISFILLSPVWMVGLCLLYVDERVRSEGYDIELMAAARLGDIPSVPETYINPLQPALGSATVVAAAQRTPAKKAAITSLDL